MPSILLSDNGVSSGSAGLKTTASNDGALALQTTTAGGTATTAVTIDTSQNVGVGTSSPAQKLQVLAVNGTGFAGAAIQNQNTNVGIAGVQFSSDTTYFKSAIGHVRNDANGVGSLVFYNASSTGAANWSTSDARMAIDSSGNLGVGTTSPSGRLHVATTGAAANLFLTSDISTSSLASRICLGNSTSSARFTIGLLGTAGESAYIGPEGAFPLTFQTNGTERARITSSGSLFIGTTSAPGPSTRGWAVQDNGGYGRFVASAASITTPYAHYEFYNPNGTVGSITTSGSATAYNTSSDYRLKEDIQPMTGALARVAALKPVTYKWKVDGSDGEGFIAHELQEVVPDAVTGQKDGTKIEQYEISSAVPATFDNEGNELTPAVEAVMGEREVPKYQGIDTSYLVATLTAAIQELNAKVDAQAAEIAALKGN